MDSHMGSLLFVTLLFHVPWNSIHITSALTIYGSENDTRPLCECGNGDHKLETRVVGGHDATRGQFPYATAIMSQRMIALFGQRSSFASPYCAGTLITDKHVLTAAHCVRERTTSEIALDIDEFDLDGKPGKGRRFRQPTMFRIHPEHAKIGYKNDIALIEFDRPIKFDHTVRAAWVVGPGVELPEGTTVTVYGWGRLEFSGVPARVLQTLDIPVVETEKCQINFVTKIEKDQMLCAGGEEGKDACLGDSGSGLTTRVNNEDVIVGVVSFGKECALPDTPGVYTKVSSYSDWIYNQTMTADCRPCIASAENFE